MKVLVTGAAGFVGAHLCRLLLRDTKHDVGAVFRHSNSRSLSRFGNLALSAEKRLGQDRLSTYFLDLATDDMSGVTEGYDVVIHCAARTFVDHSIKDSWPFITNNILATHRLLEDARRNKVKRFVQVSTDEVLGSILSGFYDENAPTRPTNPYSATKAAAEALAISYAHTYGLHTVISRAENIYGPFQHPQKVFPVFVKALLDGRKLPVYGDGKHVRQWLWVEDHCRALLLLAEADVEPGSVWHVAGNQELDNLDLAGRIVRAFGVSESIEVGEFIRFVPDHDIRPGHDRRYALNSDKLRKLGWAPEMALDDGIRKAVEWYKQNQSWLL